ncbi:MAG: hypothetical protein JJT77_06980 [Crocinitomicaceae bacterium]|nr:hypothetical protein [Crocinitomicaceae bacterium]
MFFLALDVARFITNAAWASLALIVILIIYFRVLRRIKKKQVDHDSYVRLKSFNTDEISGEVQMYVELDQQKTFQLYWKNKSNEDILIIFDGTKKKGGHIFTFDTKQLQNGFYFYELTTDNQKISKLVEVRNH